jgi:hypothetical protein
MGIEPTTYGSKVLGECPFYKNPESMKKALFLLLVDGHACRKLNNTDGARTYDLWIKSFGQMFL